MLDVFTSSVVYADHVRPIVEALPPEVVGPWRCYPEKPDQNGGNLLLVAGYPDLKAARRRPAIFLEHGSGQSYGSRKHPSYSGGGWRESVALFLATNELVHERNLAAYPDTPSVVIGCPRLDRWRRYELPDGPPMTVGIVAHWDARGIAPEARGALEWLAPHLPTLKAWCESKGWRLLGHAHPRMEKDARTIYAKAGVEFTPRLEDVFARCQVAIADNTSAGFEFLSLDRPLVWVNPPFYRRDVSFPPRFWECADAGVQVDDLGQLPEALMEAVRDRPEQRDRRREVSAYLYGPRDGRDTERAVDAIVDFHASWDPESWNPKVALSRRPGRG